MRCLLRVRCLLRRCLLRVRCWPASMVLLLAPAPAPLALLALAGAAMRKDVHPALSWDRSLCHRLLHVLSVSSTRPNQLLQSAVLAEFSKFSCIPWMPGTKPCRSQLLQVSKLQAQTLCSSSDEPARVAPPERWARRSRSEGPPSLLQLIHDRCAQLHHRGRPGDRDPEASRFRPAEVPNPSPSPSPSPSPYP